MRHTLPALLCALSVAATAAAQAPNKDAPLDATYLKDHAETRGFMLGRPVSPKPTPDGKAVLFLRAGARVPKLGLFEFDVATGKTRELLTPEQVLKGAEEHLTPEEKARRERMRVTLGGFTSFQLSEDGERILVSLSGKLYVVKRADGSVRELPAGEGTVLDPKFSPDGKSVGYVRDHDVYVIHLDEGKERPVTTGGSEKRTHGLAEFVAQEEMGRFTGWWWSPDGKQIAYEEADADGVEVWYVADPIHPDRPPQPVFYPRPGKANVAVRLGVVNVPAEKSAAGDTTWIDWDAKKYPYLAGVRWDPEGPLTLTVQTRDQKEVALFRADPATGKTARLIVERDRAWLNLYQDVPRWREGGETFLWTLESAAGGPQLEAHEKLPNSTVDLNRAAVVVPAREGYQGLVDLDPKTGTVVYRASTDPTQSQLFRKAPKDDKPEPLTREPGVHTAVFSKDHSVYVLQSVTADAMPKATVHKADGTLLGELPSVAEDPPFVPKAETVKVGDGEGFYAYVIRPHGFDAKKKYPVIDYVYGGPHHLQVQAAMNTQLLPQWLADQGFIVVALDNRGTPGRGHDFERAIGKHFGSVPLEDQVAGVKALCKKFPEMDADRVGVYGWSFGGYLAALAVLREPDVFKAAVAGAPVVDWYDYDTHYTERYLGVPDKDDPAYKEGSLLTYAADLKRPLLVVHGTADDNVYFRHSLKLTDALFRAGKDFDILPLSGLTHLVPDAVVTQRLYARIAGHFKKHLGNPADR
jgi:dipeptidyl-peptidase-4